MLTRGPGLLVSLPANELREFRLSGSLFSASELQGLDLSTELAVALDLVRRHCDMHKLTLGFVARPEIFTHGATLEWLKTRLRGVKDHLCISDGTAIRPIPGLRNHLFLYRLGIRQNARAFYRLSRCAPELPASMASQVNTCLSFEVARGMICPTPVLLQADQSQTELTKLYRFVHRDSVDESVKRSLKSPFVQRQNSMTGRATTYIPLTETACNDADFLKQVAAKAFASAARAWAPQGSALVLRVPNLAAGNASLEDRLSAAIRAIHPYLANARQAPTSVMFADSNLPAAMVAKIRGPADLMIHSSFEFWAHPTDYYKVFRTIEVLEAQEVSQGLLGMRKLLTPAFGRKPILRQLGAARDGVAPQQSGKAMKRAGVRPLLTTPPTSV